MKKVLVVVGVVLSLAVVGLVGWFVARTSVRFAKERRMADESWRQQHPARIANLGAVKRLTVLPLLDYFAVDPSLATQGGVSYLVKADDTKILFDVGGNPKEEHPLPLVANAAKLGVDLGGVSFIVISHLHWDHVGNLGELLGTQPGAESLKQAKLYLPAPMRKGPVNAKVLTGPTVLASGVASIGPITKAYWWMGTVVEQALAVNVEGKGIVLIVGCGHQSLERILRRAEEIFDAPVYGVIGGLHYPATGFRDAPGYLTLLIRMSATGKQPWHGLFGKSAVRRAIAMLEQRHPGVVALSPHDSCDWTVGEFRRSFGERYREILVGREIVVM